jgi:hypothetical protein
MIKCSEIRVDKRDYRDPDEKFPTAFKCKGRFCPTTYSGKETFYSAFAKERSRDPELPINDDGGYII